MLLIVEDNDEDYVAFARAMQSAGIDRRIRRCASGDEALDYLRRCTAGAGDNDCPLPALIVLDLNLPGSDGREVLSSIKSDPKLRSVPVVIVTTSADPNDVASCYQKGANGYLVKSLDFARFRQDMKLLGEYWFRASLLPETANEYRGR